jgi:shikimate kinase
MSIVVGFNFRKEFLEAHLEQPVILVGLMGAGKTSIGKMLADELGHRFVDSDEVIVAREGRDIPTIFKESGEAHFRQTEREVLRDLMDDTAPHVIGTGGGAFINDETRQLIKESNAVSLFLKGDLEVLLERVGDGEGRPLLQGDARGKLKELMDIRYPVYAEADITVETRSEEPAQTLSRVMDSLYNHLKLS